MSLKRNYLPFAALLLIGFCSLSIAQETDPEVQKRLAEIRAEKAKARREIEELESQIRVVAFYDGRLLTLQGIVVSSSLSTAWHLCKAPNSDLATCIDIVLPENTPSTLSSGPCMLVSGTTREYDHDTTPQVGARSKIGFIEASSIVPCGER